LDAVVDVVVAAAVVVSCFLVTGACRMSTVAAQDWNTISPVSHHVDQPANGKQKTHAPNDPPAQQQNTEHDCKTD
jgi:hypothetical protein